MKKFKFKKTWWLVDDGTAMPIACESENAARKIVEKEFNGEYERIYTTTK